MKENNINKNLLNSKQFRSKLRNYPTSTINELSNENNKDIEFKVITNTKNTTYVVLPNHSLSIKDIEKLTAAGELRGSSAASLGSIGTLGSVGTVISVGSCWSSISTTGSAGTVGTVSSAACS